MADLSPTLSVIASTVQRPLIPMGRRQIEYVRQISRDLQAAANHTTIMHINKLLWRGEVTYDRAFWDSFDLYDPCPGATIGTLPRKLPKPSFGSVELEPFPGFEHVADHRGLLRHQYAQLPAAPRTESHPHTPDDREDD